MRPLNVAANPACQVELVASDDRYDDESGKECDDENVQEAVLEQDLAPERALLERVDRASNLPRWLEPDCASRQLWFARKSGKGFSVQSMVECKVSMPGTLWNCARSATWSQ